MYCILNLIVTCLMVALCSIAYKKWRHKQHNVRILCRFQRQAIVVFNGYEDGPSIIDITHRRRGEKREPEYEFQQRAEWLCKNEDFLSGDTNKAGMIAQISKALTKRGCYVIVSPVVANRE
ncbi:hypothetical protein DPMN_022961 [Dreissena polymorpha]|uniref:Uncharacterized protein n=1 Tax=Dreissena polymorpha TaxID=45954 RepID=A0A9D4RAA6_DREPO|nr:hypothetical protein DPMN_022961 [Dreissena polymorpha]